MKLEYETRLLDARQELKDDLLDDTACGLMKIITVL